MQNILFIFILIFFCVSSYGDQSYHVDNNPSHEAKSAREVNSVPLPNNSHEDQKAQKQSHMKTAKKEIVDELSICKDRLIEIARNDQLTEKQRVELETIIDRFFKENKIFNPSTK